MPPGCRVTSAIRGLPTTMVATLPGSFTSLAWSTLTAMESGIGGTGAAKVSTGHIKTPIARERNPKRAAARLRKVYAILSSGTLTSRHKRYAAEPAPDEANLTAMCEIFAKSAGKMLGISLQFQAGGADAGRRNG